MNWKTSKADTRAIEAIAGRALRLGICERRLDVMMDVSACHANGTPLRLTELSMSSDFDFAHDVAGIMRHLDRETGALGDFFLPRFAAC